MSRSVETNRRRFLLGLAAASTAAATPPASAAPTENPKLITLANELPIVVESYRQAFDAYEVNYRQHRESTPLAPDEITAIGIGCPRTTFQPGHVELSSTLGYLYREGESYPRRIVRSSWDVHREINDLRKIKRQAKKNGDLTEYLRAEEAVAGLKLQQAKIEVYQSAYRNARSAASDDHDRLYPVKEQALKALVDHISAIVTEPDWTMEGLLIKAEALMEWNCLGKNEKLITRLLGAEWDASIASSIIRHARLGNA